MKIINATDLIVGRFATKVAKALLLGEEVVILNSEKAVITGPKDRIYASFKQKRERGIPLKGPFQPKRADLILRRSIRGMIPYKVAKGRDAMSRLTCFIGVPEKYADAKAETFEEANIAKSSSLKFTDLGTISKLLGAKL